MNHNSGSNSSGFVVQTKRKTFHLPPTPPTPEEPAIKPYVSKRTTKPIRSSSSAINNNEAIRSENETEKWSYNNNDEGVTEYCDGDDLEQKRKKVQREFIPTPILDELGVQEETKVSVEDQKAAEMLKAVREKISRKRMAGEQLQRNYNATTYRQAKGQTRHEVKSVFFGGKVAEGISHEEIKKSQHDTYRKLLGRQIGSKAKTNTRYSGVHKQNRRTK